jgi:hypothetical protein
MQEARLARLRELAVPAAALVLCACALLFEALFGGKVLAQADALYQFPPWSDVAPSSPGNYAPANPLLLDQSIVMQPWLHFGAERVHDGTAPWWNPDNYLGQPMVGTYQSAYFWPLNWVYLAFPSWHFHAWSALSRLVAAGLFTFLFLHALGTRAGPATVGALGFAFCGFQIAWLGHMHTHVALFLPAMLWAVERLAQRPTLRRAALLGLFAGGALLAGHVQTAVHVGLAVAAYAAFRGLGRRGLALAAAGAALGVLLALPQLLPFLDYLSTSSGAVVLEHFETVSDVDPRAPASLMLAPGRFGSPAAAQGFGPYTGPSGWNVNYNELIGGFVGRALLVLALLQVVWLRKARATWFLLALAVVAAGVAWQVWPFYDVANAIPKLRSTKLMRASVLLAFALACLGALGLDGLARRLRLEGHRASALFLSAALLVGAELVSFARGYNPMIASELVTPPTPVTDYLRAQPGLWRALGVENAALMPSANLFYGIPMVGGYDSMETRTTTELVALMSSDPDGAYFIKEIDYFDQAPAIGDLLGVRYLLSRSPLPPPYELALDGPTKVYLNPNALPRAFAATSFVVRADHDERLAYLADPAYDPRVSVLEGEPRALGVALDLAANAPLGAGAVEVAEYGDLAVRITSNLDAPGLVVVTDAWDASWHATVDGARVPLLRADHGLRAVAVDAGEHALEMRYEPRALRIGGAAGLLALAVLLFGLTRGIAPAPGARRDGTGQPSAHAGPR